MKLDGDSASEREGGLSWGAGLDIGYFENMALNFEYMQYVDESDFDLFSLGVGFTFYY